MTQAHIAFYPDASYDINDHVALLLRRTDGQPDGALQDMLPFLKYWSTLPYINADMNSLSARLTQYLCRKNDEFTMLFNKEMPSNFSRQENKNLKKFTGTRVYSIHNKILEFEVQWFYAISPHAIHVYRVTPYNGELQDFKDRLVLDKELSTVFVDEPEKEVDGLVPSPFTAKNLTEEQEEIDLSTPRQRWLNDHNVMEQDVQWDDDGREYIYQTEENGTPGEGYEVRDVKVFLPDFKKEE